MRRLRRAGCAARAAVASGWPSVTRPLLEDLERLVDAESRGDPEQPLRWTAKSVRNLAEELREQGHQVHFTSVAKLLRSLGYSLQANAKVREGEIGRAHV